MAGSRLEKFGTIYKRMRGLLRSGALKETDKPIWYEVYEAFPPKQEPLYERQVPTRNVPHLLYPEDIIRAQFYKTYGNPDIVNLSNERVKTNCQRFVEKYQELLKSGVSSGNLFETTASMLKNEGVRLRTSEELEVGTGKPHETKTHVTTSAQAGPQTLSVASILGEKTMRHSQSEEQDFIFEESDRHPNTKL